MRMVRALVVVVFLVGLTGCMSTPGPVNQQPYYGGGQQTQPQVQPRRQAQNQGQGTTHQTGFQDYSSHQAVDSGGQCGSSNCCCCTKTKTKYDRCGRVKKRKCKKICYCNNNGCTNQNVTPHQNNNTTHKIDPSVPPKAPFNNNTHGPVTPIKPKTGTTDPTADRNGKKNPFHQVSYARERTDGGSNGNAIYGGAQFTPQQVAQARADEMARTGTQGHLDNQPKGAPEGNGQLQTSQGGLSEGVGWGGAGTTPGTCVAKNGTEAVADAIAYGADGSVYRVRLFDSPGTQYPNEGAQNGGGRRRRDW